MKRILLIQQQHPPEEDSTPSSSPPFDLPSWHHSEILQLPHPKYHNNHNNNNHTNNSQQLLSSSSSSSSSPPAQTCSFVLNRQRSELYQLQCVHSTRNHGSFFHGHRYVIGGMQVTNGDEHEHGHGHGHDGGQLYTCTPFDITYLMIPLLERAQFVHNNNNNSNGNGVGVFIEEDDLIEKCFSLSGENVDDENGENVPFFLVRALKPLLKKYNCLHNLCESQTLPSLQPNGQQKSENSRRVYYYRIHQDRVLKWLSIKCDIIVQYLLSNPKVCDRVLTMRRDQKTQQHQHTTFRKSMKTVSEQASEQQQQQQQQVSRPADEWKKQVTVQALRIMSDNVPLRWMKLLAEKRDVSELMYPKTTSAATATGDVNFAAYAYTESKTETGDASNSSNSSHKSKRTRSGSAGETEDGEKPAKKKMVTESRSVASLKKVDTSKMKSITSFFSPKKKKTEEAESTTESK